MEKTRHCVFFLAEQFSLIAFSAAVETLRLANRISGKQLYDWRMVSETGDKVLSSGGIRVTPDGGLDEFPRDHLILICGGVDIKSAASKGLMGWLRRQARLGNAIGGLCTGSYILAATGLLSDRKCTIHWENRDSFTEDFPEIELMSNVYVIDGERISAAGGVAAADLFLALIAQDHGTELANAIADQMVYTSVRTQKDEQRLSVPTRIGTRHPKLASVISMMEENIEEPISPAEFARRVGLSTRQLERLFRRYLNRSPKRYFMELRLQKARNLLIQTDMSVINVAMACGFMSPSHFSKCYRAHYDVTPYRERGNRAGA